MDYLFTHGAIDASQYVAEDNNLLNKECPRLVRLLQAAARSAIAKESMHVSFANDSSATRFIGLCQGVLGLTRSERTYLSRFPPISADVGRKRLPFSRAFFLPRLSTGDGEDQIEYYSDDDENDDLEGEYISDWPPTLDNLPVGAFMQENECISPGAGLRIVYSSMAAPMAATFCSGNANGDYSTSFSGFDAVGATIERRLMGLAGYGDLRDLPVSSFDISDGCNSNEVIIDEDDDVSFNLQEEFKRREANRKKAKQYGNDDSSDDSDDSDKEEIVDYYALLGLEELRHWATPEDIRKAYRRSVLKYHPDKNVGEAALVEDDETFKSIQKAYDCLSVPKLRLAYDSKLYGEELKANKSIGNVGKDGALRNLPCSENVVAENEGTGLSGDFFTLFSDAFRALSLWSEKPNPPQLGNPDSTYEKVDEFYNFWFGFSSWRDFSYLDEHKPSEASDRAERRWMDRQNEKDRQNKKREEGKSIRKMVDAAFICDPRIKRHKDALKKAKEDEKIKKKEAREASEQKMKEELLLKEQLEKEQIEITKKEKEAQKQHTKRQRTRLRKLCKENIDDIELLCRTLDGMVLESVCDDLENKNDLSLFYFHVKEEKSKEDTLLLEKEITKEQVRKKHDDDKLQASINETGASWTDEELALLIQAIKKFPGGTRDRWTKIAKHMGSDRSEKEIIAMVKKFSKQDDLSGGGVVGTAVTGSDPFEKFKKNLEKKSNNLMPPKEDEIILTSEKPIDERALETGEVASSDTPANNSSPWTVEQQQSLEAALKTYPASLGQERWTKIGAFVPGKTRKECVARYKEIVALVKAKKGTVA